MTHLDDARLVRLERDVKRIVQTTDEIRRHAAATNGRVRELERWQIEVTVRDDERRRLAAEAAAATAERRAARHKWIPPTTTGLVCVTAGWALSHFVH